MVDRGQQSMTRTPSRPIQGRPMERRRTVHIVIHRLWRQDSRRRRSVVYGQECRWPERVTAVVQSVGSRPGGHLRFVVCRRFVIETTFAEANSFLRGCQPFCNIAWGLLSWCLDTVTAVADVKISMPPEPAERRVGVWFDLGKSRQYPRTVAHKRRHGCDPRLFGERAG
jgi:hypothetical protein